MEHLIFEFVIRSGLIALTTALLLLALRIRNAAAQHAVWAGVLILMLALPIWISWGPKAALPVLPARGEQAFFVASTPPGVAAPEPTLEIAEPPVTKPIVWSWDAVLIGVYLFGVGALLLRLAMGTMRASRLTSASCVAPVTVGLFRPRVILPDCWREWPQTQLDAVLTHENAHARRRDPLFQWLALFNRAVFWFHPLAWWLERQMSALAEEACDAAVLERGHDPREYSAYLLELARAVQRAGTRVNVVAVAMPGSYLPQRVKKIIDGVRAPRISPMRMACTAALCAIPAALFAAGTLGRLQPNFPPTLPLPAPPQLPAVALAQVPTLTPDAPRSRPARPAADTPATARPTPVQMAQVQAPPASTPNKGPIGRTTEKPPAFDVASVRRGDPVPAGALSVLAPQVTGGLGTSNPLRVRYERMPLGALIFIAFAVPAGQISGEPAWMASERYDIVANIPPGTSKEQFNAMLGNLLRERFGLRFHMERRTHPVYLLRVDKRGPKLRESAEPNNSASSSNGPFGRPDSKGYPILPENYKGVGARGLNGETMLRGQWATISDLIAWLAPASGRLVVDETGLTGHYNFEAHYLAAPRGTNPNADEFAPDVFAAVQDQLGLKLESGVQDDANFLVIDSINRDPTGN